MSTEAIGTYSPDTVYGQLTSPFTPQKIKINAHTPYDKVDENESKVFSREYFKGKPQAKMIYELPENENKNTKSSKDIVQNSLKRGYTPEQAVAVTKAQDAYKKSAVLTTDPTGVLSTCAYKVA